MPMCTSASMPFSIVMPTACLALAMVEMVPLTGATISPLLGVTAKPSPSTFVENTSSATSSNDFAAPSAGEQSAIRVGRCSSCDDAVRESSAGDSTKAPSSGFETEASAFLWNREAKNPAIACPFVDFVRRALNVEAGTNAFVVTFY